MKTLGTIFASKRQHAFGKSLNRGRTTTRRQRLGQVEQLEYRQLLAAIPLATLDGAIATAGDSRELNLTVNLPQADAMDTAVIGLQVTAAGESTFAAAAPRLTAVAGGTPSALVPAEALASSNGLTLYRLPAGEYTIHVTGQGDDQTSVGAFQMNVFLLGDSLDQNGQVDQREHLLATAAAVQNLGTANLVTNLFFRHMGVDLSQGLYDEGMDANGNGAIDGFDLAQIQSNQGIGPVVVQLTGDSGPPVIEVQLDSDTGLDAADGITTDAAVRGTITDDGAIESFLIGVDGPADSDLLAVLGDLDPNGDFVLSQDDLESLNGGPLEEGQHTLRFQATDELGNVTLAPTELTFTLLLDNQAPTIDTIGDQTVDEDTLLSLDLSGLATDPDTGDLVTITVTQQGGQPLPSWLEWDPDTNVLHGTPENADVGSFAIEVVATDTQGANTTATAVITVENVNDPPTAAPIPDQIVDQDSPYELDAGMFLKDVDVGDTLTFEASLGGGGNLPNWLQFDPATHLFSGTPTKENVGEFTVLVKATDSQGEVASDVFNVRVANVNDSPILLQPIEDQTATEDQPFQLDVSTFFTDPDADDELTFGANLVGDLPLPAWLSLDPATGILSGTPGNDDVGQVDLEITATDSQSARVSDTITLVVVNVNDAPTLVEPIPDQSVIEDTPLTIDIGQFFQDIDGDQLTWVVNLVGGDPLPDWLQLDANAGLLTGQATNDDVGTIAVEVVAVDQNLETVTDAFDLTVTNQNDPPTLVATVPDQSTDQDALLSIDFSQFFTDIDPGDTLTFSAVDSAGQPLPAWLGLDPSTGLLTGTPTNDDVGTTTVQVTATDSESASVTGSFTLAVNDLNDTPVIADQTFSVEPDSSDGTLVGTIEATDPDAGDQLSFTVIEGDPGGALTVDSNSGQIRVADAAQLVAGQPLVLTIEVTDSATPAASATATITVNVTANGPPTVSDIPGQLVDEGVTTTFDAGPFFNDPEGDVLTFSATLADDSPLPLWLSLDPASGVFQVSSPTNDDVGTVAVQLTATDAVGNETTTTFSMTVVNVNDSPEITSPIPAQAVNQDELLQLDVASFFRDPDPGDTLTYAATLVDGSALPAWLELAGSQLSGTPGNDDVGALSITITATDSASASTQQTFNLTVNDTNDSPTPGDDPDLTTNNTTPLSVSASELLANDTDPDAGDTLTITGVSVTSEQGATVTLDGDQITYDPSSSSTLSALLPEDQPVVDTFQYTVQDASGATATATVSVTVGALETMRFRMQTTDLDGNPITTAETGENFLLQVYVEDIRDEPSGVFSAYLDVTYDPSLAAVSGDIQFGNSFAFAGVEPGTLDQPGLIDEVGAIAGLSPTGAGEFLVFNLQFTAGSNAGTLTFAGDPADDETLHPVLFFDPPEAIPTSQVDYGRTSIEVVSTTVAALSGSALGGGDTLLAAAAGESSSDPFETTTSDTSDATVDTSLTPAIDTVHAQLAQQPAASSSSGSLASSDDVTTGQPLDESLLSDLATDVALV